MSFLLLQIIFLFPVFVKSGDYLLKSADPISRSILFSLAGEFSVSKYTFIYFVLYSVLSTVVIFVLKNKMQMLIFAILYLFFILTAPLLSSNYGIWLLLILCPLLLLITRQVQYNILLLSIFFTLANCFLFYQPSYNTLIPSLQYLKSEKISCDDSSQFYGVILNYQKLIPQGSHTCDIEENSYAVPGLYLPLPDGGVLHAKNNS